MFSAKNIVLLTEINGFFDASLLHNYMDVIVFLYGTLKRKVVSINPSAITKNNKKSSPVHSHWLYVKLQVIPLELRTIYLSLDRTGISQSKSFNSNLLKYENQLHRRPSKFFFSNQFFPIFSSTVYCMD
ncbi:hypothetical protein T640_09580 [Enterococcus faecium MRSN 3418]|nr:hypothetical protein T640_09580 [Enterococcus faecium MRSN 3418]